MGSLGCAVKNHILSLNNLCQQGFVTQVATNEMYLLPNLPQVVSRSMEMWIQRIHHGNPGFRFCKTSAHQVGTQKSCASDDQYFHSNASIVRSISF